MGHKKKTGKFASEYSANKKNWEQAVEEYSRIPLFVIRFIDKLMTRPDLLALVQRVMEGELSSRNPEYMLDYLEQISVRPDLIEKIRKRFGG